MRWQKGMQKIGGRKRGTPNKTTLQRAAVFIDEARRGGKLLMRDILSQQANECHKLALAYAPHRNRAPDDQFPADEKKFIDYAKMAIDAADKGAPYETPKLANTTLMATQPDEPIMIELEVVK
jgi:hypothetical protein